MKKQIILSFTFTFILFISAQSQVAWNRVWDYRYGGTAWDVLMSGIQAPHHGYLLGGKSLSDSSGNRLSPSPRINFWHYWIVRIDSLGQRVWERALGGTGDDNLASMVATSDGGFLIGGSSDSPISGNKTQNTRGGMDYWIVKLDSLGNIQWDKDFGGSMDDELHSVQQTMDGGYLLGGNSRSGISGDKTQAHWGVGDFWIIKTNSLGVKQWDRVYGGTGYERLVSAKETTDGGYFISGQSGSPVSGDKTQPVQGMIDYWTVKTDSAGLVLWDKDFGSDGNDMLLTSEITHDNGYILGGHTNGDISGDKTDANKGWEDYWVVKIDSMGIMQWNRDYGTTDNEDEFSSIYQTPDRGYLLGVTTYNDTANGDQTDANMGLEQSWVIKIDSLGDRLWDKTIFNPGHDEATYVYPTINSCYVILGLDNGPAVGGYNSSLGYDLLGDYWVLKVCPGEILSDGSESYSGNDLFVFPNPLGNELNIQLSPEFSTSPQVIVRIVDECGKIIMSETMQSETQLLTSHLSPGFYLLELISDNRHIIRKLIK
ncbi:MAG: T9SS type A sorting domain-containing protein [Bacteroidetes bacterium]|nr:T9SS type A sorting domain-containing protein [Bacteroidota bacterium]